ncbi:DNA (cytosine-5)-methyltransferase 1 [Amorphus orientalis]|uniref:DNA (cytosine-5-)-methyltransferase n=1 Tax=Amorphus orientalis TaxID=649198 RepID=A0AAE3VN71_9HYPH|nr:DNA cytosine methyltransferase [Amorphus orientalis]MDQ0314830.1 DNA (cytosine-5)-methyltransferase 1 [Amorphus orientalis]
MIIDSFAGGGGASVGIERALGRSPDYAINHDAAALAMHRANHPDTVHLSRNIWQVDPMEVVGLRPVGLLWASPDCKHHSKAKGGRPVKRAIRDLAWTVVLWARRARPRVIILENVEEFRDWGPLKEREGGGYYPDPERRGQTFDRWVGELKRLGYRVQWRELRACDYGAPTIRKRLFLIARRDGKPIVWPKPTHGAPDDPDVIAGLQEVRTAGGRTGKHKLPWRTAAEIIDWSLPCPSIFETSAKIKAKWGVRANRPLAEATLRRVAKGVVRYVLEAKRPFIVPVTHAGDTRCHDSAEPLRTVTTANRGELAFVTPFVSYGQQGGLNRPISAPLHTVTASAKDTNAVITPFVTKFRSGSTGHDAREPLATVTANGQSDRPGGAVPLGVVAPYLVPRYGERPGQEPRTRAIDTPHPVVVPTGNGASLVAAFLAQHNTDMVGHDARAPVSTIVGKGCTQGLVAAHMINMKGSARADYPAEHPVPTITASTGHAGIVAAFLAKYYGAGDPIQGVDEALHTVTTKPRHGLVTVTIDGAAFVIVDIGMRMLTPRERFRAQGFPDTYRIDAGVGPDGEAVPLTQEVQGRCCGNSVSPDVADALVEANCADMAIRHTEAREVSA